MDGLFRDLARQRLRSALTISGVALGIFTLIVLGALGEHFRGMVADARQYTRGMIRLFTKTNAQGINPGITEDTLAALRGRADVTLVRPCLLLWFDGFDLESDPLGFMRPRPMVLGLDEQHAPALRQSIVLTQGRWLAAGDERQAMVVSWLAQRRGLELGAVVRIRHKDYELVGIYEAPDVPLIPSGIVPYRPLNEDFIQPQTERAQRFFKELLSRYPGLALAMPGLAGGDTLEQLARRFVGQQQGLFRMYDVIPRDRSDAGTRRLAAELREQLPDLAVIDPDHLERSMDEAIAIYLVITSIVTAISTLVGGLLIVNTMAMAVLERRREIAIKAAVGASSRQIVGELVSEAGLIGLIGAALGILGGFLAITLAEPWLIEQLESGVRLFLITPRLVAIAASYGIGMGVLAGALPALRAARIDPAVTLREL